MIAAARLWPVDQIIGAHDRSGPAAVDRTLEGEQFAFAVRGLVDLGVPAVAVCLVRIEREMLDRRHDARRLRPQNRLCPHDARPMRVLRYLFVVTAVPCTAGEGDTAAKRGIDTFAELLSVHQ